MNLNSSIKNSRIHYINIKNSKTYEPFLNSLNEILLNKCSIFDEVQKNFLHIKLSEMNIAYFMLKSNDLANMKGAISKIIYKRFSMLESNEDLKSKNSFFKLSILQNELNNIYLFDDDFKFECESVLFKLRQEISQKNRKFYINELEISSNSHLSYINESLNSKFYCKEKHLETIRESHIAFLKQEFFDIIKACFSDSIDIIYEDNFDIIQNQISKDNQYINKMFQDFINKNETRKKLIEQNTNESFQKGFNYVMKENENLREFEVTVEIKQKLKDVIEQDF